jgi:cell division protein FtsL
MAAIIILFVLTILMAVQIAVFYKQKVKLEAALSSIMRDAKKAEDDYAKLEADYEYYQNPANLEKELRARFNLRLPDEKLMVVVPKAASIASSTTSTAQ